MYTYNIAIRQPYNMQSSPNKRSESKCSEEKTAFDVKPTLKALLKYTYCVILVLLVHLKNIWWLTYFSRNIHNLYNDQFRFPDRNFV